jgi:hypothetical protein
MVFVYFIKCLNVGKFPWLNTDDKATISINRAQLAMLLEGGVWTRSDIQTPPKYAG